VTALAADGSHSGVEGVEGGRVDLVEVGSPRFGVIRRSIAPR
jgi:hypothetical protein